MDSGRESPAVSSIAAGRFLLANSLVVYDVCVCWGRGRGESVCGEEEGSLTHSALLLLVSVYHILN